MNKSLKLFFTLAGLLLFSQVTHAVFSDVSSNHPYYKAITYLQENNIVEGYEDGSYRPDTKVNRAEALKIILLGSNVLVPEISEQDIFPDVLHGSWYAKYTAKAKNLGIVNGDGDTGMFRPGDTINLAEIIKILLETNNIELPNEISKRPYSDVPTEAWFAPYFAYADSVHLLDEDDNFNVFPAMPVTRGLMAQLMYQLDMKPEGYQEGESSYYGEKFHGKGTASGEVFDASGFTAAHRTLPFNTWLRVKNLENGKEVYVRVNDRGPYAGDNRIIDLSKAAFESISPLSRGVINVSITPVDEPPKEANAEDTKSTNYVYCPKIENLKYLSKTTFENITLDKSFPNTIITSEVLTLSGISASNKDQVSAFVMNESGDQFPFYANTDNQGRFKLNVSFPIAGEYKLGILPGKSGSSIMRDITVLAKNCIPENTNNSLSSLSNLKLRLRDGNTIVKWTNEHEYDISKLTFLQGSKQKTYIVYDEDELIPNYPDFEGWSKGSVTLEIQGANLDSNSVLEAEMIDWSPKTSINFKIDTHYEYNIVKDNVAIINIPNTLTVGNSFTVKVDPKTNVQAVGKVVLPNGFVKDVDLTNLTGNSFTGTLGSKIFPDTVNDLRLTYTPTTNGIHFIEINDEQNLAVLNIPVYPNDVYPLLPNTIELSFNNNYELIANSTSLQNEMMRLVNSDRADHGLSPLSLDLSLSKLAQSRSDDMVTNNYFGHWNPDGFVANDLRGDFAIRQYVSENLSRDMSPVLAEYGLMRSAAHRQNILSNEWKRAGFGFTEDPNNGIIFVQIFSEDPINFSDLDELRSEILLMINNERSSNISLNGQLNDLSQSWSERMASEDFFSFTAPDNTGFVDTVRDAEVNNTLGTYIVGNSSFGSSIEQIINNEQIKESRWKNLGIGIKQDLFGIIKITLVYTE